MARKDIYPKTLYVAENEYDNYVGTKTIHDLADCTENSPGDDMEFAVYQLVEVKKGTLKVTFEESLPTRR